MSSCSCHAFRERGERYRKFSLSDPEPTAGDAADAASSRWLDCSFQGAARCRRHFLLCVCTLFITVSVSIGASFQLFARCDSGLGGIAHVDRTTTSHLYVMQSSLEKIDQFLAFGVNVSEDRYQRSITERNTKLREVGGVAKVDPFDLWRGMYIWDWFSPAWNCVDAERIGTIGDGGKWLCGLDVGLGRKRPAPVSYTTSAATVAPPCTVYSYGVNQDSSFELAIIERAGCVVHGFDPTVGRVPAEARNEPKFHFHKQAIAAKTRLAPSEDGMFMLEESLTDTMRRLGHDHIDVLKVDVEGAEWAVFEALIEADTLPFDQLLIELHYADTQSVFAFFDGMERAGFRAFSRETNHQPCVAGRLPVAVEYSFLRKDWLLGKRPQPWQVPVAAAGALHPLAAAAAAKSVASRGGRGDAAAALRSSATLRGAQYIGAEAPAAALPSLPLAPPEPSVLNTMAARRPNVIFTITNAARRDKLLRSLRGLGNALFLDALPPVPDAAAPTKVNVEGTVLPVSRAALASYEVLVFAPENDVNPRGAPLSPLCAVVAEASSRYGFRAECRVLPVAVSGVDWPSGANFNGNGCEELLSLGAPGPSLRMAERVVRTSLAAEYACLVRLGDAFVFDRSPIGYDVCELLRFNALDYGVLRTSGPTVVGVPRNDVFGGFDHKVADGSGLVGPGDDKREACFASKSAHALDSLRAWAKTQSAFALNEDGDPAVAPSWLKDDQVAGKLSVTLDFALNAEFEVSLSSLWKGGDGVGGHGNRFRGVPFSEFISTFTDDGIAVRPGALLPKYDPANLETSADAGIEQVEETLRYPYPSIFGDDIFYSLFLLQRKAAVHVFTDIALPRAERLPTGLPPPSQSFSLLRMSVDATMTGVAPLASLNTSANFLLGESNWTGCGRIDSASVVEKWPVYERQEAAAMYVLAQRKRLEMLLSMLRSFEANFNSYFKYPIVVFEDDLTHLDKAKISETTRSRVIFDHITLELPAFIDPASVPVTTECERNILRSAEGSLGYRHMCRFQAFKVNARLEELGFEWQWRMDDDSVLTGPLPYDPFGRLKAEGKRYAFINTVQDAPECVDGLWEAAAEYIQRERVGNTEFLAEWPAGMVVYNNFEISHASVWRDDRVVAFFDYIDQEKRGVYTKRWGDAPIKTLALALYIPAAEILRLEDVGYRHDPFVNQLPGPPPGSHVKSPRSFSPSATTANHNHLRQSKLPAMLGDVLVEASPATKIQAALFSAEHQYESWLKDGEQLNAWLGGDVATSITIPKQSEEDSDVSVWLFGDTLIGGYDLGAGDDNSDGDKRLRSLLRRVPRSEGDGGRLVRNSVGTMRMQAGAGEDVRSHSGPGGMDFWWHRGIDGAGDRAIFVLNEDGRAGLKTVNSEDEVFAWPLTGLCVCSEDKTDGCRLVVIAARVVRRHVVRSSTVSKLLGEDATLDFRVAGSVVFVVENPRSEPTRWVYSQGVVPGTESGLLSWHAAAVQHEDSVYLLGVEGSGVFTKQVLARLPYSDLLSLEFGALELWALSAEDGNGSTDDTGRTTGRVAWSMESNRAESMLFALERFGQSAVVETGVAYHTALKLWYYAEAREKSNGTWILILYTSAASIVGPWTATEVYVVPQALQPLIGGTQYFVYAVKPHPELESVIEMENKNKNASVLGVVVLSYIVNIRSATPDLDALFEAGEANTYVPQFVALTFSSPSSMTHTALPGGESSRLQMRGREEATAAAAATAAASVSWRAVLPIAERPNCEACVHVHKPLFYGDGQYDGVCRCLEDGLVPPPSLLRRFQEPASWPASERYLELVKGVVLDTLYDGSSQLEKVDGSAMVTPSSTGCPRALSMVGQRRLDNLHMLINDILNNRVRGDIIETGSWRGGAMLFAAALLRERGELWSDNDDASSSSVGIPPPKPFQYPVDKAHLGAEELPYWPSLAASSPSQAVAELRQHFSAILGIGSTDGSVVVLQGWFNETLPSAASDGHFSDGIALLRLDGDTYESTMQALESLYPLLNHKGFVVVDDYMDWEGCRRAVLDFRAARGVTSPIVAVYHDVEEGGETPRGVWWQKI